MSHLIILAIKILLWKLKWLAQQVVNMVVFIGMEKIKVNMLVIIAIKDGQSKKELINLCLRPLSLMRMHRPTPPSELTIMH